jgi:hypothetical protein
MKECVRSTCGMILTGETEVLGETLVPVPLCSPQIYAVAWDGTEASVLKGYRLTTWAMTLRILRWYKMKEISLYFILILPYLFSCNIFLGLISIKLPYFDYRRSKNTIFYSVKINNYSILWGLCSHHTHVPQFVWKFRYPAVAHVLKFES